MTSMSDKVKVINLNLCFENFDIIELDMDSKDWPVPSYGDLLYSVK